MTNIKDISREIKRKANIIDVIKHYENVEKTGSNSYKAKCPIHSHVDNNPSLSISEEKQVYNCFVCQKGGDVFTFVQEFEQISYDEAVIKVSQIIGEPLDRSKYIRPNINYEKNKNIYNILNDTIKLTQYTLKQINEFDGKQYLNKRGLTSEMIDYFQIGQVNHNNQIHQFLLAKHYDEKTMLEARLVNINEFGTYDVFKDRIMFPIHDEFNNPVGFTARTINNDSRKYINSSESVVYKKGNILYNLNRVLLKNNKPTTIYLTEGVMDAISLHIAGIENAIASLGTSLTDKQVKLLKKINCKVVIAYDGDNAGYNATYKASQLFMNANIEFQIVYNTLHKDFDDIIKEYGIKEVVSMCQNTLTYTEFIIRYFKDHYNLDNHSDKKEFIKAMQRELLKIKDDFDKEELIISVFNLTGHKLKSDTIVQVNNIDKLKEKTKYKISESSLEKSEKSIIFLMINKVEAIIRFKEKLGYLNDEYLNRIAMRIIDYYRKNQKFYLDEFILEIDNKQELDLLLEISNNESYNPNYNELLFDQLVSKIIEEKLLEQEEQLKVQLKHINGIENQSAILKQLDDIRIKRRRVFNGEKN